MGRAAIGKYVALLIVVSGVSTATFVGCGATTAYPDPCPDADPSLTIGGYCDEILPAMCDYAVNTCGVGGTVAQCITNARPTCCQGTCNRNVCPVDRSALSACVTAYAGPDAGLSTTDDAGASDGGIAADAGLACSAVDVGFAPLPCQSIIVLR